MIREQLTGGPKIIPNKGDKANRQLPAAKPKAKDTETKRSAMEAEGIKSFYFPPSKNIKPEIAAGKRKDVKTSHFLLTGSLVVCKDNMKLDDCQILMRIRACEPSWRPMSRTKNCMQPKMPQKYDSANQGIGKDCHN